MSKDKSILEILREKFGKKINGNTDRYKQIEQNRDAIVELADKSSESNDLEALIKKECKAISDKFTKELKKQDDKFTKELKKQDDKFTKELKKIGKKTK